MRQSVCSRQGLGIVARDCNPCQSIPVNPIVFDDPMLSPDESYRRRVSEGATNIIAAISTPATVTMTSRRPNQYGVCLLSVVVNVYGIGMETLGVVVPDENTHGAATCHNSSFATSTIFIARAGPSASSQNREHDPQSALRIGRHPNKCVQSRPNGGWCPSRVAV